MKGLSLTQPWATLVAIGAKKVETRGWQTQHRGPLAIHAAKAMPLDCRKLCQTKPFYEVLEKHGLFVRACRGELPRGFIIATANLTLCMGVEDLQREHDLSEQELAFGDYSPGRFGWYLEDIRQLPEPIPCRGMLSLWDVPAHLVPRLAAEAA